MDLTKSFLDYLEFEKRYSPHTLEAYQQDIQQYLDYLTFVYNIQDIYETQGFHLRSWMVSLHEHKRTNRTINRKISALKSFFNFLRKRHGLVSNPTRKLINPRVEKRLPVVVRKEQLDQLLKLNRGELNDFKGLRDNLVLDILYSCGLRRSELIQLKSLDFDWGRRLLKVEGKGKKERWIPVSPELIMQVQKYLTVRNSWLAENGFNPPVQLLITDQGQPLYPKWVYNFVKSNLSLVTSVERRSPHIIRHSFATHLSDAGADLNAIKTLLGHASLAATQVYMHNSVEKLKKIYDQAHPKS
ncbi:MAG: tyrosine-type recombinase/integrase [Saprospiraceae bacterium]|nr:tyrosine-type recombinase/integrase [Saprospiraceae bacterium]